MSYYYMQSVDPVEIAARFSNEDIIDPIHGMAESWIVPKLEKIHSVLERLPGREADLIRLYFFKNKKQTDIAEIFGITQAAVSYRLSRATKRLKFLIDMPPLEKEDVFEILLGVMPSRMDAKVFSEMYVSTCQSEVAEIVGITQGKVRHRYIKNLRHLGFVFIDRMYSLLDTMDPEEYEARELRRKLDKVSSEGRRLEDKELERRLRSIVELVEGLLRKEGFEEDNEHINFALLYRTFVRIRYNFNILREVKLPRWANRATKSLM